MVSHYRRCRKYMNTTNRCLTIGWLNVLLWSTTIIFIGDHDIRETGLEKFAFLRTPQRVYGNMVMVQGGNDGRDHHNRAFSIWLAGGGIRGGTTWGASDELGFNAVENPVHVHDLNATLLHLLGMDHTRLTYRFQGRDYRLTDVHGQIVDGILA